ncbi:MAG: winged helix-turn-helix transcriptional regulator [Candidatus Thermoplasmatota archaeon]
MRTLVPQVTAGPRSAIYECVERSPGIHLRQIERLTALPLGQVLYHLDRLERMGLVGSVRDSGFRRFFSSSNISRAEKPVLAALRHTVPRQIIMTLLGAPGIQHKDIQERVGVAGSTLSFHLQRLVSAGVLDRRLEDAVTARYHVQDAVLARRELLYYRESFQDPRVDEFVERLIAALPS